jgi:hypothetical protein
MNSSTIFILSLKVAAAALVLTIAACGYLFRYALRSPKGYEDEDGFHIEPDPLPRSETENRPRRREGNPLAVQKTFSRVFHHRSNAPEDLESTL